nr:MAG TPA: hypothetical protein [Caudoviricetes sp.]
MFPNLLIELKKQRCTQQDLAQHSGKQAAIGAESAVRTVF